MEEFDLRLTGEPSLPSRESPDAERAKRYASYIVQHANRAQHQHLFSGSHFRGLSDLVSHPTRTLSDPTPFDFIVCCDFGPSTTSLDSSTGRRLSVFDAASTGLRSFASLTPPGALTTRVVFVRGYPSAGWINVLGSQYRIEIDYFRQKLSFLENKDYFDMPPLPSNSKNIFHLGISTIYQRQVALTQSQIRSLRGIEKRAVRDHHRSLKPVGDSIVRHVSIIDETNFVIGQDISIYIANKRGRGRIAIVWLDSGRELSHSGNLAWEALSRNKRSDPKNDAIPIIRQIPAKMLGSITPLHPLQTSQPSNYPDLLPPCTSHLAHQYGLALDHQVASTDLGYALSDLFIFAACGEAQFLNLIEQHVMTLLDHSGNQETAVLDELNYVTRLLRERLLRISSIKSFLRGTSYYNSVSQKRDTVVSEETQHQTKQRSPEALQADTILTDNFNYLSQRAEDLMAQATSAIEFTSSRVMLEESRRAINKADRLERLTLVNSGVMFLGPTLGGRLEEHVSMVA
ncbi:hypothetical protein O1611_g1534 [Lasiodiplodia mahajangana]|uniref:Uncharacterized protein n=1 Tax=Lasiodiplodia mahajangana TaxID=1108764 RepID=A0ACC2JXP4_9PEZI|nr:hypothetical protein O1611_g1534 [Lasiodiplodia mahajangana]